MNWYELWREGPEYWGDWGCLVHKKVAEGYGEDISKYFNSANTVIGVKYYVKLVDRHNQPPEDYR